MSDDDHDDNRTVIRPSAKAAVPPPPEPPADGGATIIKPVGAAAPPPAAAAPRPSPPDMGNHLPVGTYLGEFEVTNLVGEGGFGIVYLAQDHSLERRVALKEYMPSALAARTGGAQVSVKSERHRDTFEAGLKSFVNEARLLAQFDHPSLVKVYRFWEANGTAYMVMPFYEGITLKDRLKELGQPPDEAWLMDILEPLTEALLVIHAEQCFHRDIAPDNVILLKGNQRPLLLDFGAARRVIGDMTQALTVILKPGYAPVEQYAEVPGMKQGPWTDVYALAAVVYFAIMGKTPPTSVGRLMNDSYVPLVQSAAGRYSERFLAAIDHALVVKPEERTQSIGDLRHDLGLETASAAPRKASPRREAARSAAGASEPAKSKLPLIIGGGIAAAAAVGFGLYTMLSPGKAPAPPKTQPAAAAPAAPAPAPAASAAAMEPPAPAAAPIASPSGEFDPAKEFERVAAAQSPDYAVVAAADTPRLRINKDPLHFSVKTEKEGYLYVFVYGTDGGIVQLFPNGKGKNNKIRAGSTLKLPPANSGHLMAIVSAYPREFPALGLTVQDGFAMSTREAVAALAKAQPAGAAPIFLGKPVCEGGCTDNYGVGLFTVEEYK